MTIAHPDGPIVILGASYARGWNPNLDGRRVLNRGVTGQQSWELLARFETDVTAASPRAVILWGFINDIFRSPRAEIDRALARARDSFTQMVELSRAKGIEPVLATEVTIRPRKTWQETFLSTLGALLGRSSYQDYVNAHVMEVNTWLRTFAREQGVLLLDLQPVVSDSNGRRRAEYATEDGSHITAEGYAALSAYAVAILKQHLESAE